MVCPQCGTEMPEGEQVCPNCGYDARTPAPAAPDAAGSPGPAPQGTDALAPPSVQPTPDRRSVWFFVGIGAAATLVLVGLVLLVVLFFVPTFSTTVSTGSTGQPSVQASAGPSAADLAAVEAGQKTVSDFYSAMNAGDLEKLKATVVPDVRPDIDSGMFEDWSTTTFEFTRGWVEQSSVFIAGRESQMQFGSGDRGGVKFTLDQAEGKWLISDFWAVDKTQLDGSITPDMSTGIPGPLTEATAKDLMIQVLAARKSGDANAIRRLATETFLLDNEADWLSGLDNTDFFTSYQIDSVSAGEATATVTVTETWTDGTFPTDYGLVAQNGAVLLDNWESSGP